MIMGIISLNVDAHQHTDLPFTPLAGGPVLLPMLEKK
jgi:hypothetical protein